MAREWQPGDVAMVNGEVCMFLGSAGWEHGDSARFRYRSDETDVRPLVVIDPEDAEQVERLRDALPEDWCLTEDAGIRAETFVAVQAALREFANPTPPKPDEPQGLGAVVVDRSQVEHVHLGSGLWAYGTTDGPSAGHSYADINAVRVLSEGVVA